MKPALIIVTIFLTALGGFLAGKYLKTPTTFPLVNQVEQNTTPSPDSLFQTQTATFQGKITKVEGANLQVESETGHKTTFPISNKLTIYKFGANSATASPSADLKTIEVDKLVLIMLELIDGKYQAVTISYFR